MLMRVPGVLPPANFRQASGLKNRRCCGVPCHSRRYFAAPRYSTTVERGVQVAGVARAAVGEAEVHPVGALVFEAAGLELRVLAHHADAIEMRGDGWTRARLLMPWRACQ